MGTDPCTATSAASRAPCSSWEGEGGQRAREGDDERERESEKGGEMGEWRENVLERREANRERREKWRGEGSGRKER